MGHGGSIDDAPPRGWRRWAVASLLAAPLLVLALGLRVWIAPVTLPATIHGRIEARLDAAVGDRDVAVGEVALMLPPRERLPALVLRDVTLAAPDGQLRAAVPTLAVGLAPGPMIAGRMDVRHVQISGAQMNVIRSSEGQFDLGFGGDAPAGPGRISLQEALAWLDTVFDQPGLAQLERIAGTDLEIHLSDAATGRTLRLHDAELALERDGGSLRLGVSGDLDGTRAAEIEMAFVRDAAAGETQASFEFESLAARDVAALSPALGWLDLVTAPIDGQMSGFFSDDGRLGAVSGVLEAGAGHVAWPGEGRPFGFEEMSAEIRYDPERRRTWIDQMRLAGDAVSFSAQGHGDWAPDGRVFVGQITLEGVRLGPVGMIETPLTLEGAQLEGRLTLGSPADEVMLEIGRATVFDGDLRAQVSGQVVAREAGLSVALDAHVPQASRDEVLAYWPETLIPNTRWWVADRLLSAEALGADMALRLSPDAPPRYELSFDFRGADILALPAAPPIRAASGFFTLHDTQMRVVLDGGSVSAEGQGPVDLAGSGMQIADVSQVGPEATFDLNIAGQVPDLMHVLAGPPFQVLAASGFAPDEIGTGRIVAEAALSTRLQQSDPAAAMAGLDVSATGLVTGFDARSLVPGRLLSADRITVDLTPEYLAIGGPATLDGVPLTGQWRVLLDPEAPPGSEVTARAALTPEALSRFGVALPDWMIAGETMADLRVALQSNRPAQLNVTSDLSGLSLAIPALAWRMGAAQTGRLDADITLGPRPEVTRLELNGGGLSLVGAVTFTADGWLDRLSASRFRVGQWLDVRGGLIGRAAQTPAIEVSGGILDFRTMPSLANTGESSGDVGPLDIRLDRMQITEGIALTDLRADLNGATMSGDFRGSVNGAVQVGGQLIPSPNGPSVRMQSADGGAVVRAAGIFDELYEGRFDLILAARPEPGQYDGRLSIDGPRLRNAPVMAELLNVISVVGLLDQLSGEGINMGEIDARFRVMPQRIVLDEGTAVGPAMGLSMDGAYDVASGRYEMQGVISPLYIVNGVFGALFATRREGLFGFNYRLIGEGDETRVSVNPLSILTPGIFREIFRAPPPDFAIDGGN